MNAISEFIRGWLDDNSPSLLDHASQFDGATKEGQRRQLVIGLDYGTAYTKVVVGDFSDKHVIPIGDISSGENEYLLRGTCTFSDGGECALGSLDGDVASDMKMRLIEGKRTEETIISTICFLSLVLRRARLWVLKGLFKDLKKTWIDWAVNVGLPTESFENSQLAITYRQIVGAAWILSCNSTAVTRDDAKVALSEYLRFGKTKEHDSMPTGGIHLFPEFAAQVAGYCTSPRRRDGLHLLVDVGAGTVDGTVFNVWNEDDEECLPVFERSVRPLGARFLVRHRLNKFPVGDQIIDEFGSMPSRTEFSSLLGISKEELEQVDSIFRDQIVEMVRRDLVTTKEKRYHTAREWEEGVPTFLTGGGARMDVYRETIVRISTGSGAIKLEEVRVPEPSRLNWLLGQGKVPFDRVMVAYGLSMDPDDLARVIPSSRIEDTRPDGNGGGGRYTDNYPSKEMT